MPTLPDALIRKPEVEEAPAIQALLEGFAARRLLLPRTLEDIYEHLREFFVAVVDDEVAGCGALRLWGGLAEVRSLAVVETQQKRGVGAGIVRACVEEARRLHVDEVFALTFQPEFFERLGFVRTPKERFPHKIWTDCVKCPHFPDCGEVALVLDLRA